MPLWKTFSTWYASGPMRFATANISSIISVKALYAHVGTSLQIPDSFPNAWTAIVN